MPRRKRPGRKRYLDLDRYESGELKKARLHGRIVAAHEAQSHRDDIAQRVKEVALRVARETGLSEIDASRPEAKEPLGALMLSGTISRRQFEAGKIYEKICLAANRANGIPSPHAKTGAISDYVSRGSVPAAHALDDDEYDEKRAAAHRDIDKILDAANVERLDDMLVRHNLIHTVRLCVIMKMKPADLASLRRGLDIIADHYKIPEDEEPKQSVA